jgi:quercetin dioxygenase-like cupin family protein
MTQFDPGFKEVFNITAELEGLAARKPWQQGLTSKTLLKTADFRMVLIAMEPGAKMHEHHNDGRISIHVLKGALRLQVKGTTLDLGTGHILALDRAVKHDVEAVSESAFLLTIAWPSDQELAAQPHRGYGS